MKKLGFLLVVIGVIAATTGCGVGYRMQEGAIVGAAIGAMAGHDIGEDRESTLIGATIGGVAGAVIGDAMDQYEADNGYAYPYYQQQNAQRVPPKRKY